MVRMEIVGMIVEMVMVRMRVGIRIKGKMVQVNHSQHSKQRKHGPSNESKTNRFMYL